MKQERLLDREPELDLTMVVPYFNPGDRLRPTIDELIETLSETGVTFEIITVSDGSTDASEETLVGLDPGIVRTLGYEVNQGKGQALRVGLGMGRGRFLGFIDADGDLPPRIVARFVTVADLSAPREADERRSLPYHADMIIGTKRHPDSIVVWPPLRRLYSWMWQHLVLVLFQLKVRDTQTGLKLISRETLAAVLPRTVEKRFAFDLELLVVARRLGFRREVEVPVTIRERFGSTVSIMSAFGMFFDAFGIFYRLHVSKYYDRPSEYDTDPSL